MLIQLHQLPFIVTQIQCLGDHKILGKWIHLHKYNIFPLLVEYGSCCPIEPLAFFYVYIGPYTPPN